MNILAPIHRPKYLHLTDTLSLRKRDGTIVVFDQERITRAIESALKAVKQGPEARTQAVECSNQVCAHIVDLFHARSIPAVEQIQDLVEETMMRQGYYKAAKAYILYREHRSRMRDSGKMVRDIESVMSEYLDQTDWRVRENANVNYSLGGLILHNSGSVTAHHWLNVIYPKQVADAHRSGSMHIHDLGMFSGYCAGWSLRDLLSRGLSGVPNRISSGPPAHLSTAVNLCVNWLGVAQNEWAGAQAFSSFDTLLAPFVRYDQLAYKDVKQQIQSFVFGVNTPSRWGSQAPFTNITLDWTVPEDLKNQAVVVRGELQQETYAEFQHEMDMINRALLEILEQGDIDGRGFPYPIPTYNITKEFDWNSENADLLFRITAKYGTPYFQNFISSDLRPEDVRSMCCRLQLDKRELRKRGGGLFGAAELTGSIGVVTLNMPRLGYMSRDEAEFLTRLDHMMDLARDSLELKREIITRLMHEGLFPYSKAYLGHWNNHFSTIGLVGMHECALNLLGGDVGITHPDGHAFVLRTLEHMRTRLAVYQQDTGNLYNLEATPAEATSYRLARADRKLFSDIRTSGAADPYYTNSSHLPVQHTEYLFEALSMQEPLQQAYTGGTVFHAHLGERIEDPAVCRDLVRRIAENFRIPYFTISPTFSVCTEHGYLHGEQPVCPSCNSSTEVYARIVGYYRPVKNWNRGKAQEYVDRTLFSVDPSGSDEIDNNEPLFPEGRTVAA